MSEKDTALAVLAVFASCLSPVALFLYVIFSGSGFRKVNYKLISVDTASRVIWIIYASIQANYYLIGSSVAAVVGYLILVALVRQKKLGVTVVMGNPGLGGQKRGFQGLVGHSPRTQGCAPQR